MKFRNRIGKFLGRIILPIDSRVILSVIREDFAHVTDQVLGFREDRDDFQAHLVPPFRGCGSASSSIGDAMV
jgi:hypothetical protein